MDEKQILSFAPGEVLLCQGELSDSLFFILTGTADVEVAPPERIGEQGKPKIVGTSGPGDVVGELAFFVPDSRRTATVRAKTLVVAERTTYDEFRAILSDLREKSPLLHALVHALAHKLVNTTQQVVPKS